MIPPITSENFELTQTDGEQVQKTEKHTYWQTLTQKVSEAYKVAAEVLSKPSTQIILGVALTTVIFKYIQKRRKNELATLLARIPFIRPLQHSTKANSFSLRKRVQEKIEALLKNQQVQSLSDLAPEEKKRFVRELFEIERNWISGKKTQYAQNEWPKLKDELSEFVSFYPTHSPKLEGAIECLYSLAEINKLEFEESANLAASEIITKAVLDRTKKK